MPLIRSNKHEDRAELRTQTGAVMLGAHSSTATDAHAQEV